MAYSIKDTRNNTVDTIADAALTTTDYGIQLPGKNYAGYGDAITQTLYPVLENFACPNSGSDTPVPINPTVDLSNPVDGQLWFDTSDVKLRIWNGTSWGIVSSVTEVGPTPPVGPSEGDLWFNSAANQLFAWDATQWLLIGPEFANNDSTYSTAMKINAGGTGGAGAGDAIAPSGGTEYDAFGTWVNGTLISIVSTSQIPSPTYYYIELNDGSNDVRYFSFSPYAGLIEAGINIESGATDYFNGRAKVATTADALTGAAATVFMQNAAGATADLSRRPAVGSLDVGHASFRWGTVYATNFDGVSTSSVWADLAEKYEADLPLEAGTVVKLGGIKEITATTRLHDEDVFGVVSTNPALKMNSNAGLDATHPYIALVGRVPVKVVGRVSKGQRLAATENGCAIGITNAMAKKNSLITIGRALEDKNHDEVGLIEVAIAGGK